VGDDEKRQGQLGGRTGRRRTDARSGSGEIKRLMEAHGVSLRLPTRNERFSLNLVQPRLVVKKCHVRITTVCAGDAKLAAVATALI
jgi:hypothetical protein